MNTDYQIAFFDIDGTLKVVGQEYVPDSAIRAINRLKDKGVKVIICSGRNYEQTPVYVKDIGFDYYICNNGAQIKDGVGNTIYMAAIPTAVRDELLRRFTELDCTYLMKFSSGKKIQHGDMRDLLAHFFKPGTETPAAKEINWDEEILLAGAYKDPGNLHEEMRRAFPSLNFFHILGDYYDFSAKEATKGNAIRQVCQMLHVERDKTIAFGDGENDVPMFESAGMSVAMGNAKETVKTRAKYVTAEIEDDGILKAVEKFFP